MTTARRRGRETSETRGAILDAVERLMISDGYGSVSYRAVATATGVTPGLVQYYFPGIDGLFEAAVRRRAEENLQRLVAALDSRPDEPLHVIWETSREEASAALMTEFLALANHRKAIRSVIADVSERSRQVQVEALRSAGTGRAQGLRPEDLAFLANGVPKVVGLEAGAGLRTRHDAVAKTCEKYIDVLEPRPRRSRRTAPSRSD